MKQLKTVHGVRTMEIGSIRARILHGLTDKFPPGHKLNLGLCIPIIDYLSARFQTAVSEVNRIKRLAQLSVGQWIKHEMVCREHLESIIRSEFDQEREHDYEPPAAAENDAEQSNEEDENVDLETDQDTESQNSDERVPDFLEHVYKPERGGGRGAHKFWSAVLGFFHGSNSKAKGRDPGFTRFREFMRNQNIGFSNNCPGISLTECINILADELDTQFGTHYLGKIKILAETVLKYDKTLKGILIGSIYFHL